jgi:glyoxalase I/lactoylglutathione lyase
MSFKFLHTCYRVQDLDKSLEFYQDVLGFEISRKRDFPEDKFTLVYLKVPGSDYELELTYNYDKEEPYTIGDGYGHIAIGVDDLEATHKEYSETVYEVTDLKALSNNSTSYFFIKDPDGYKVEVIQN